MQKRDFAAGRFWRESRVVKKYNNINVIATSNQPGTTGEVLEEAVKSGPGLTGMKWIQIHPHGNPKNGELESAIAGRPSDTPYVNVNGDRFVDETGRRDDISHGSSRILARWSTRSSIRRPLIRRK